MPNIGRTSTRRRPASTDGVRLGKGADGVAVLSRKDADPGQVAVVEHRSVQHEAALVAKREEVAQVLPLEAVRLRLRLISHRSLPQEHQRVPPAVGHGLLDLSVERIGHAPILSGGPAPLTHLAAPRRP
jgi:hypothetical protein